MRNSYWIAVAIMPVFFSVQAMADSILPVNVTLPSDLTAVVTQTYEQSATFRAQCDRLAQEKKLYISVRFDFNIRSSCLAFTIIRRGPHGVLCADVHVPPPSAHLPELIAHEFEHILEQVENLDMRSLARVRGSGVREVERDLFESDRAQRAGRIVAEELRGRGERRPSAD